MTEFSDTDERNNTDIGEEWNDALLMDVGDKNSVGDTSYVRD